MFKKVIIVAVIAMPFSCSAGKRWDDFCAFVGLGNHGPINHANHAFGVGTHNFEQGAKHVQDTVEAVIKNPKGVQNASHGAAYGTTYGALAGAGNAIEDGIHKHPYVAGTAVTLGAAAVVYHMLPGQEDYARWARLKAEEEQHKVALEQHKVVMEETKKQQLTLATATELRTCLNTHGRCRKKGQRVPSPCNSPTRRSALYDLALTDSIVNGYNKYA